MRLSVSRFYYEKLNKSWLRFYKKQIKLLDSDISKGNRYIIGLGKWELVFYVYNN
jgi:hypothetical protein